ncbi:MULTISPECIES: hypothetical protein [Pseudanabaena]|uniref:Uncharacterized protein n=2 Tax=Pseudanabaena TaxID=1152 RepID=L8N4P9_9CYAN|nr:MULTISPECIES: hypothetical protein [Pseudanabaena]ELS34109.1 hypothetical protein Pse7429DRAFT_0782 [Pseudanabaena biceps PCC 7429]MDG3493698.1 hypothetical protein [Pseudanabaena catenata USMAC16]
MEKRIVRQLIIEHLEQLHQKPYADTCLGGDFDLKFISKESSEQKYNYRATWIGSFFEDLTEIEQHGTEFFPTLIKIYLDDETGEIWTPFDPYKKLTSQEKCAARKKRRQTRRNQNE